MSVAVFYTHVLRDYAWSHTIVRYLEIYSLLHALDLFVCGNLNVLVSDKNQDQVVAIGIK